MIQSRPFIHLLEISNLQPRVKGMATLLHYYTKVSIKQLNAISAHHVIFNDLHYQMRSSFIFKLSIEKFIHLFAKLWNLIFVEHSIPLRMLSSSTVERWWLRFLSSPTRMPPSWLRLSLNLPMKSFSQVSKRCIKSFYADNISSLKSWSEAICLIERSTNWSLESSPNWWQCARLVLESFHSQFRHLHIFRGHCDQGGHGGEQDVLHPGGDRGRGVGRGRSRHQSQWRLLLRGDLSPD